MSDEQTQSVPAGWYPDPHGSGPRWWNGQAWHEPVQPAPPTAPPPGAPSGGYGSPGPVTTPAGPPTPEQERNWAMWCHLATLIAAVATVALSAGLLALFLFVVPLVFLNMYGNRSAWVRAHAVEELNFQLSVLLYSVAFIVAAFVIGVVTLGLGLLLIIPVALGIFVWYVVVMILATTAASRGEFRRYMLTIRFVR